MGKLKKYKTLLRKQGYKLTPQREAILAVMMDSKETHLTPEKVCELTGKAHPQIGLTTVYRTLEIFRKVGLVNLVHFHDGVNRYEMNHKDHHHHLICLNCKKVEEVAECMIQDFEKRISSITAFKVTSHCFGVFGYCGACQ